MRFLIWALLGSGNKDAGASGAVVFWQFSREPPEGGDNFSTNVSGVHSGFSTNMSQV